MSTFSDELRNTRGRPQSLPWADYRDQIARQIAGGWGLRKLADHYGMSVSGMRLILGRLGLRTLKQEAERAADVTSH